MNVDAFSMMLAVIPAAIYMAIMGIVRIRGRHLIITSARDTFALAIAAAGFLAAGPAQLFFPSTAAMVFGGKVWIAIAVLYALVVTLITLMMRPGIVIHGRTASEVYGPLLRACHRIDETSIGEAETMEVKLKTVGLRLRCDGREDNDCTRIVSFAPAYGPAFWNRLVSELRAEEIPISANRKRGGAGVLVLAVILCVTVITIGWTHPAEVAAEFRTWLFR